MAQGNTCATIWAQIFRLWQIRANEW